MKKIIIKDVITPDTLASISSQIEEQEIVSGDQVDVLFDTVGGDVDVALEIAQMFQKMQLDGIELRAVANGKVWSSGIVPFLECRYKVARKGSSFLVHTVSTEFNEGISLSKDDLQTLCFNIDSYTQVLHKYYLCHGIHPHIAEHLWMGGDLLIDDPIVMQASGFIDAVIDKVPLSNQIRNAVDTILGRTTVPTFSFVNSFETNQHTYDMINKDLRKEIGDVVEDCLSKSLPGILAEAVKLINQSNEPDDKDDPEYSNEGVALSDDELEKLKGTMFRTEVKIEDKPEVKAIAHPCKNVEKDHFVVPLDEKGDVIRLSEGNYKAEINGEEHTIHATGEDWYLTKNSTANEEMPDDLPPENKGDGKCNEAVTETPPDTRNTNKASMAPKVNKPDISPKTENVIERYRREAMKYGATAVGTRRK